MKFRTEIVVKKRQTQIDHRDKTVFIGSCFTDNIGGKLEDLKFSTYVNPFGILYNPVSVYISLNRCLNKNYFTEDDLIFNNGLYHSLYHHSQFSSKNQNQVLENINKALEKTYNHLKETRYLFLTFGTARVYRYIEKNIVTANCHKLPGDYFNKELLVPDQTIRDYDILLNSLRKLNREINIVFTVSPVRHWRDGAFENNVSKGVLFNVIDSLLKKYNYCSYFPSYEIVMDELRDYRYFSNDLLHPSSAAVDYIMEKFSKAFFNEETHAINSQLNIFKQKLNHRPFFPETPEYLQFVKKLNEELIDFSEKHLYLDFSKELLFLENAISGIDNDKSFS